MSKLSLTEFNQEVNISIPYLKANITRLKFSETITTELETLLASWNKIFTPSQDKSSRTSTMVAERNTLRKELEKKYASMQQTIKNNAAITLNDEDYKKLFIHQDKEKSTIPAPSIIPKVDVIGRSESTIKIQISNPAVPQVNYTKIPKGVQFINIFVAIVTADAPVPVDADYHLFIQESKSDIVLKFDTKDEKKVAYIRAQFANKAGVSRLSDAINSVIPN